MKKTSSLVLSVILMSSLLVGCGASSSTTNSTKEAKDPDTITIAWLPNNAAEDFKETRAEIDKHRKGYRQKGGR